MSRLDIVLLSDRGFVRQLWVGMGRIGISVSLIIGIGIGDDTGGLNFSLFYPLMLCYGQELSLYISLVMIIGWK